MTEADGTGVRDNGFMELRFSLEPPKPQFTQQALLEAAQAAAIHTLGWPIGIVTHDAEGRPKPTNEGIVAEVKGLSRSYDYWAWRTNGDFYSFSSLLEARVGPGRLYVDTRVVRVTEALLYCVRMYTRLGVDRTAVAHIGVRHGGLEGRHLSAANPRRRFTLRDDRVTAETEVDTLVGATLAEFEDDLIGYVKKICGPLFVLFDFFDPAGEVYKDLVDGFVAGQVR